jgi:UTP:GlnB (protein PII) uridylyltransferase
VAWVAKWYFDVNLFFDLVDKGFLTQNEYDLLVQSNLDRLC